MQPPTGRSQSIRVEIASLGLTVYRLVQSRQCRQIAPAANWVYGDQIGGSDLRYPDNFRETIMNLLPRQFHALQNVSVRLVAMLLSRSLPWTSLVVLLCLIATPVLAQVTPMVAAGASHTVALKSDGTVVAWGYNDLGQVGDGTGTSIRLIPVAVPGLTGVVAVAAGELHTVALKADGTVVAWGYNDSGQLGDGTSIQRNSPVAVLGLTEVVAVAAGDRFTVALKSDGTVVAWGQNSYGQLGDGTTTNRSSPVAVPGLNGVTAVAAGYLHTVALKSDGTVVAWGYNGNGQLGDGTTTNRASPVAVQGLTDVVAISVAEESSNTAALKSDGTVVGWGFNGFGQLGDGTTTDRSSPIAVPGLTGVVAVAGGAAHTMALKSDGTVVTWGRNNFGQLGDGTTTDRSSPVAVPGLTGVVAVAGGEAHTLALKADGTVMAWGNNNYGQLGDGTYRTQRLNPLVVQGGLNLGVTTPILSLPLSLNPILLTFGTQNLGASSAVQTLTLTNTGSNLLGILEISASVNYIRTTNCNTTLAAGANCTINVAFRPTMAGVYSGAIAVVRNGTILTSAGVTGTGVGAVVSLDSTSLSYTAQNVGTTSTAQTVTFNNSGNTALNIASIVASGDYAVTHNCGTGLGVGGFCNLNITFTPTAIGSRTGTVTITDDAFDSPQTISLSGTGQGAVSSLSTTTVAFASQSLGSTSTAQSITLTNSGAGFLNIISIVVPGDFAQTTTCGASLAQGTNCTISVTFKPTAAGTRTGSLVITSNAASSPNSITLSGTGVAVPVVSLNLTSLTFAAQNVGTSSVAQVIALTNTGGATLNLTGISATGDYAVTNNCGAGLGAGGSCSLSVSFRPTVAGTRNGTVSIASNAAGSPHTVSLNGVTVESVTTTTTTVPTTTTTTTASTTTTTLAASTLNLNVGWNLVGNSSTGSLDMASAFSDTTKVTTIWKWIANTAKWAFYAPSLVGQALIDYAAGKGYDVLTTINGGEGFWVNAKAVFTAQLPAGATITSTSFQTMVSGWNLIAIGDNKTPSQFNALVRATTPLTTLWAWDATQTNWYFYAPSLEAMGGTALTDYITGKGYLDFTANNKTLGPGVGFWVNKP